MQAAPGSGTLGHLSAWEDQRLQQTWIHLLRLFGDAYHPTPSEPQSQIPESRTDTNTAGSSPATVSLLTEPADRSSDFLAFLTDDIKPPQNLYRAFWAFVKTDHPDALVLRFLRARKWEPEAAVTMFLSALQWRIEKRIDEKVVRAGEAVALKEAPTPDDRDFLTQYRSGISYVRGGDREGRSVYIVKVRLHDPKAQSHEAMEQYVLHTVESLRILARQPPDDKACLIFDMTGFGMRNANLPLTRFLIEVFEARYPETLGAALVHNAPFVFWVKGWLDPVVVSKITFTKTPDDMDKIVSREALQTEYGGSDPWQYEYVEPVPGENDRMKDDETRNRIQLEHDELAREFTVRTARWTNEEAGTAKAEEASAARNELAARLYEKYWELDPYIRARTYYDRVGAVDAKGAVNYAFIGRVGNGKA